MGRGEEKNRPPDRLRPYTAVHSWTRRSGCGRDGQLTCVYAHTWPYASPNLFTRYSLLSRIRMAKTVSARVNEEVAEWLERYAEAKKTTKARIVEDQVLELYRREQEEEVEENSLDDLKIEEAEQITFENPDYLDGPRIVLNTEDRDVAKEIRDHPRFSSHLAESDDRRMTEVRFADGTPQAVIRDAYGHMLGRMDG